MGRTSCVGHLALPTS
ncbi:hypothetical protein U6L45_06745 [Cutibacterium acnes]